MNLLFIHHNFPGQFAMLLRALAAEGRHRLVFLTHGGQVDPGLPGVTVVRYVFAPVSFRTHGDARHFDEAMRRAEAVATVARGLNEAGFLPDLVIGHEGWGDTLNLRDVWPGVPQIGFREYYYHEAGTDVGFDPAFPVAPRQMAGVRAKNAVALLALAQGHAGVSPTAWQRALYPAWAQPGIHLVEDAADLDACAGDPASRQAMRQGSMRVGEAVLHQEDEVVTFVASSLEPYRGLHTLMRALPALMARPRLHVVCLGGVEAQYGPPPAAGRWWDVLLAEVAGRIDPARLHGPGRVPHDAMLRLLRRSDVHLYLSYPFIVSWSLRDAMACGCTVLAADTAPVRAFIRDGGTGVLVPPLDPGAVAAGVSALLDDPARRGRLGAAARDWAERHLRPDRHVAAWRRLIETVSGRSLDR